MNSDGTTSTEQPAKRGGWSAGKVIALIAIIVAFIFIVQNTSTGKVSFLFWGFDLPTWIWTVGLFLLGGITGYSYHWSRARARRKARRND